MFDEQPDGDPHGECAAEIHRLEGELRDAKRLLGEAERLAQALERIAGFTVSQFMGPHDMALECVNVAREALDRRIVGNFVAAWTAAETVESIAREWDGCMAPMFDPAGNPTGAIDVGATIRAHGVDLPDGGQQ